MSATARSSVSDGSVVASKKKRPRTDRNTSAMTVAAADEVDRDDDGSSLYALVVQEDMERKFGSAQALRAHFAKHYQYEEGSETLEFTTIQAGVIAELWADAPTDVRAFFKTAGKRKKDWEDAQHYLIENKVETSNGTSGGTSMPHEPQDSEDEAIGLLRPSGAGKARKRPRLTPAKEFPDSADRAAGATVSQKIVRLDAKAQDKAGTKSRVAKGKRAARKNTPDDVKAPSTGGTAPAENKEISGRDGRPSAPSAVAASGSGATVAARPTGAPSKASTGGSTVPSIPALAEAKASAPTSIHTTVKAKVTVLDSDSSSRPATRDQDGRRADAISAGKTSARIASSTKTSAGRASAGRTAPKSPVQDQSFAKNKNRSKQANSSASVGKGLLKGKDSSEARGGKGEVSAAVAKTASSKTTKQKAAGRSGDGAGRTQTRRDEVPNTRDVGASTRQSSLSSPTSGIIEDAGGEKGSKMPSSIGSAYESSTARKTDFTASLAPTNGTSVGIAPSSSRSVDVATEDPMDLSRFGLRVGEKTWIEVLWEVEVQKSGGRIELREEWFLANIPLNKPIRTSENDPPKWVIAYSKHGSLRASKSAVTFLSEEELIDDGQDEPLQWRKKGSTAQPTMSRASSVQCSESVAESQASSADQEVEWMDDLPLRPRRR